VVKVTIYLTDMSYFERIVALRQQWFSAPYPADTIVEVKALALPELMIEIEAIATTD
jgi:enamine deaminase RidA (YjgF/YER057c/UK114 family)